MRTGQEGRHSKTSFDPPRKESEWAHSIRRVNSSKSIVIHGQSWGLLERAVKAALQLLLEQQISSRNVFMGSTAYHKSLFFNILCFMGDSGRADGTQFQPSCSQNRLSHVWKVKKCWTGSSFNSSSAYRFEQMLAGRVDR